MHPLKYILFTILTTLFFCVSYQGWAQTAEVWVQKGIQSERNGDFKNALECYSQAVKLEPQLATAWFNRGVARIKLKQYSMAVVDLNKCILLDTGFQEAYFNRALALWRSGNLQFALTDISKYLAYFPYHKEARELRFSIALEAEDWDLAIQDLKRQSEKDTLNKSDLMLATLYEKAGNNDLACKHMERAISLSPDDVMLQHSAAMLFQRTGRYQRSMEILNRILLVETISNSLLLEIKHLKADNFFFMKDYTSAADMYTTLLQSDTGNANLLADYGHCLLQLEKYTEAEIILTRALRMKSTSLAYIYLGRGLARVKLQKGNEACEDWGKSYNLGEKAALKYLETYCNKKE
jgi:tetratricopeptide (TPR) repeat protein